MSDIDDEMAALAVKVEREAEIARNMHRLLSIAFIGVLIGYAIGSPLLFVFSAVAMLIPCVWIEVKT